MKVTFAHICDYATISREGKLSVLGIFSTLGALKFPVQHPLMHLVFEVEMSSAELNSDITARIELRKPDGERVTGGELKFRVGGKAPAGEKPRFAQIAPIAGTRFDGAGTYEWTIWLNGIHQCDVPFKVFQITPAQAPNQ